MAAAIIRCPFVTEWLGRAQGQLTNWQHDLPACRMPRAGIFGELMITRVACCASSLVLLLAFFAVAVAAAQETPEQQAVRLQEQAQSLYDSGRYQDGIDVAKRAVAFVEQALGPEHPAVAVSLQALGHLYLAAGNYDLAQSTHQRALALREKALGAEHPDTALARW